MTHHPAWIVCTVMVAGCSTAAGTAADATRAIDGAHAAPDAAASPDATTAHVLDVFDDDYGAGVAYAPFGGSTDGPTLVGDDPHSGNVALRFDVPAAGYTGGAFKRATPVDLSSFTAVSFWARASASHTLDVVGLGNDAATTTFFAEWNAIPLTTTWTHHVLPIPDPSRLTAEDGLFHVAEGASEGAYTLWLDDIQYVVAEIGAPSPAIATETIARPVGQTFPIEGAAVTYDVDGTSETIATARRYFTFHSSDPSIATVDDDGLVTALAVGTTTITAKLGAVDAIGALTFQVTP